MLKKKKKDNKLSQMYFLLGHLNLNFRTRLRIKINKNNNKIQMKWRRIKIKNKNMIMDFRPIWTIKSLMIHDKSNTLIFFIQ